MKTWNPSVAEPYYFYAAPVPSKHFDTALAPTLLYIPSQLFESVVVTVKGPAAPAPVKKAAPASRPGWSSGEIIRPASDRGRGANRRGRSRPFNGGRAGYGGPARGPYRGQKRFFPW
jgi:hypothetical protein